jgi:hydrogenase maturation factor
MTSRIQLHEAVELETLLEIVRDLKAKAYDAFEKLITDHTRKLYGR